VIEVNAEGSKAAAVTMAMGRIGCSGMKRPLPPPLVDFVADHPYLMVSSEVSND
jgi:serine protease inhibitor